LRRQSLRARAAKKFKTTTNSNHSPSWAENLLQQNFIAPRPSHVWVADITYIATDEGWLYLAVVLDLHSRKVVGWSMSARKTGTGMRHAAHGVSNTSKLTAIEPGSTWLWAISARNRLRWPTLLNEVFEIRGQDSGVRAAQTST